jgi:outer membrane protein assembly factor BamD
MRKIPFYILVISILFASCSGYEKLLKSSDYVLKYNKAFEYYNKQDYARASTLFDQMATVYRGTDKADSVYFYQAKSYYELRDYVMAGHYFKTFVRNFPNSPFAEESDYYSAYCFYKTSPRPSLDQADTYSAIESFRLFIIRYPRSEKVDEARKLIAELSDKLVDKSYQSARLYFDMSDYRASIVALTNSLSEYPDTKYREELMFLLLKSNYLLADNSVVAKQKERFQETVDEYFSFISEFPSSKYRREADRIFETSNNLINN